MVFYPDHSGIALYSSDFAFYAAEKGHEVSVVTAFPFYPRWKKQKKDKRVLFRKEIVKGVNIYRGYIYVPENLTTVKRIIQELIFLIFAFFNFLRAGRPDCIVIFTTPVSLGFLGSMFKFLYRSGLVINVQDFQLEAADSLGMVSKSGFIKFLKYIEKKSYNSSDIVSSISESMLYLLKEKGVEKDKIIYWPNWIGMKDFSNLHTTGNFRRKNSIPDKTKIIAYAGNVGLKQGLQILIELSGQYTDRDDLLFLIIGEGGDLENLKNYYSRKNYPNFRFIPFLNQEEYKEFLADADVIFVSQKKTDKDVYFPSKLLGLMASSKLVFLSADPSSELFKVISRYQLGITTRYGDLRKMKESIDMIISGNPKLENYKRNAFNFILDFDRSVVLDKVLLRINGAKL
jgi:colanic acid biosynthesis glycosyl transferase WcaI